MTNPTRLFYARANQSQSKRPKTPYNSRGIKALNISASGFLGYTANRHSSWFKLQMTGQAMDMPGVRAWLEDCTKKLYIKFNSSNFYEALGEMTPDMHAIGTGIIYTEEDVKRKSMVYQCRHPKACWLAENAYGQVDTVHEEIVMTYKAAMERFELSGRRKEVGKKNPYQTFTIRHAVFPFTDEWRNIAQVDPDMPFCSVWYDEGEDEILDTGGYWEFPFVVGRYAKASGEVYGRSPGIDALGDILGANQMTKSRLRLAQLVADPTLAVPEDLEGQDDVVPGGRIYMPPNSGKIEPVQIGANYPITIDTEQRQDEIISDHFNVGIYLMLQQAQGQMTAREVIERTGEKASVLGYISGRFNSEVLQPMIQRTFNIMIRAGELPPPPQALLTMREPAGWDIEFLGLMAQMQRKYYSTSGINSSIEYIGTLAQMFPESLDNIDSDSLIREALDAAGTPASVLRDKEVVQEIRAIKQQQQQQMMQQQQDMAVMQNMDKMNHPIEEGSPLEALAQAAAAGQA
jgi:hypothetical protein